MSLRVAISGYYGFGNTGDEAIALAITRELKRQQHKPILFSQTPVKSSETYGCEAVLRNKPGEVFRALMGCQILLSGGGGLLQDHTSGRTLAYYLGIIRLAKMLRKPVVVFNQSVGPLSERGEQQIKRVLRHKRVRVVVRDRISAEYLRRLHIPVTLGADPALLLQPTAGISSDRQTVVVAPRGDVRESLEPLRELVKELRQQDQHVIALSMMPSQDDEAAHFLEADRVVSATTPQQAIDVIASSGYVVGVRLHALILAAAVKIPFVGITYDPKVKGFCKDVSAPTQPRVPNLETLTNQVYGRVTPQWGAIGDMRLRAMQSFGVVTGQEMPKQLEVPD